MICSLEAPSGTVVASASSMSVAGDGGEAPPLPPPKRSGRRLFISTGDTVPLVGKCAYVLRLHDRYVRIFVIIIIIHSFIIITIIV